MENTALWAGQFRRERQKSANEEQKNYNNDKELEKELIKAAKDITQKQSKISAIKHGLKLGLILRQKANDLQFNGLGFWFVLIASGIKDFSDIITISFGGLITTWIITPLLFIFFFMRKSYFKRFIMKRFMGKYIALAIAEFFPGTSIFPGYVIGTLLLKTKIDKKIRELKSKSEDIDREVTKLQNSRQ